MAGHMVARRAAIGGLIVGLCLVGGGAAAVEGCRPSEAPEPAPQHNSLPAQAYMCAPIRYPLPGEYMCAPIRYPLPEENNRGS